MSLFFCLASYRYKHVSYVGISLSFHPGNVTVPVYLMLGFYVPHVPTALRPQNEFSASWISRLSLHNSFQMSYLNVG